MGREKDALTQETLEFLGELYLKGDLVFKEDLVPKKNTLRNKIEMVWIIKMMQLIKKHHLTPRQAQIQIAETKEFIGWNKRRSKIKKNQEYQHYKDAENLWSKYMRMGGIMSSLKRNKKGSVKGIKKGNTRKKI